VQLFPIRHRERRAGAQTDRQMTYMQLLAMLRKFYSKFVRVIFEICGWTDRQIDREADGQTGERRTDRQTDDAKTQQNRTLRPRKRRESSCRTTELSLLPDCTKSSVSDASYYYITRRVRNATWCCHRLVCDRFSHLTSHSRKTRSPIGLYREAPYATVRLPATHYVAGPREPTEERNSFTVPALSWLCDKTPQAVYDGENTDKIRDFRREICRRQRSLVRYCWWSSRQRYRKIRMKMKRNLHRVKWRHRIYGHDTIAILWV